MHGLFIYGSLGPGGPNEHILAGIGGDWAPGHVKGALVQQGWGAQLGYPGLVLDGGEEIRGHVFTSDRLASHLSELDDFEGAEYERQTATVILDSGSKVQAWVYALRSDPTAP